MNPSKKTVSVRALARVSLCAALMAVCAWISIPTAVPFTMQTFAVFFALLFLDGRQGLAAIGVYIALGAAGLPVFAGFQGGPGVLLGPTGGYILGFLLTGLIYGLCIPRFGKSNAAKIFVLLIGLLSCYAAGSLWYICVYAKNENAMRLGLLLSVCVIPYIIPDLIKLFLAVLLSRRLKRPEA